jgi:glucose/arabinose dehydrogenase
MRGPRLHLGAVVSLLLALVGAAPATADTTEAGGLRLVPIGTFDKALYATGAPGDPSRIYVVEQGSGTEAKIWVVHNGVKSLFLSLTGVAHRPNQQEQGLFSMAFAPDYPTSRKFYVYYNDDNACTSQDHCDVRVDEFTATNPDDADEGSRRNVLQVTHNQDGNHNGGQVAFGPDGLLYAGPGDGGQGGDPQCDAQLGGSLLGKILRLDPRVPGATPQIYASGFRNPFRFSFDRLTGDLIVGDVGELTREEVSFLPAGTPAGANFGWPYFEGDFNFSEPATCPQPPPSGLIPPSLTMSHPASNAVTGGVVVRDASVVSLWGRYLYADYYDGVIRSAVVGPGTASGDGPTGLQASFLAGFGEDALCRVYVASQAGPVYRLEAVSPAGPPGCRTAPGPAAPGPPLAADTTSPSLSSVAMSRRVFRVSRDATPRVAAVRRRRTPVGTTFRWTLSERASVTLRFYRARSGRRSARRCVPPTRRLRRARRCTRYPLRGTLVRRDVRPGRRFLRFTGRIGVRALPPGRYRVTLRARDAAGNLSPGRALSFTVVRR